jgi:hypothetical protein
MAACLEERADAAAQRAQQPAKNTERTAAAAAAH